MDKTQSNNTDRDQNNVDGSCEPFYNDPQVSDLYNNGLISRVEADVYDLIADFNDNGTAGQLVK